MFIDKERCTSEVTTVCANPGKGGVERNNMAVGTGCPLCGGLGVGLGPSICGKHTDAGKFRDMV